MITQKDTLQGHKHEVYAVLAGQNKYVLVGSGDRGFGASANGDGPFVQMRGMENLSGYGDVRYSSETRSINTTIKIWKRTA